MRCGTRGNAAPECIRERDEMSYEGHTPAWTNGTEFGYNAKDCAN